MGHVANTMGNLSFMKLGTMRMSFNKAKSITANEIKYFSPSPDYSKTVYAQRDSERNSYSIAIVAWDKLAIVSLVDSSVAKQKNWDLGKLSALQWNHPDTIIAKLNYEQGLYSLLKFNPTTQALYTVTEGSLDKDVQLMEANEGMLSALKVTYKKYNEAALEQMYQHTGYNLGGGLYVGQVNAKDLRYDVRLFDLNKKTEKVLFSIQQNKDYRNGLKGAVLVGDKVILAMNSQKRKVFMLQVDKNTLEANNMMTLDSDVITSFRTFNVATTTYYIALQLAEHPLKLYHCQAGKVSEVIMNEQAVDLQMNAVKAVAVFLKKQDGRYQLTRALFKLKMNK